MTALEWIPAPDGYVTTVATAAYIIVTPGKGRRRPFTVHFPEGPSATTDTLREAKELAQLHADAAHVETLPEVLEDECHPDDFEAMIGSMIGSTVLQIVRQTERQAHAVHLAREHGLSWSWIGEHLGVTKQSAQAKFTPKTPPAPPQAEGLDL